MITIHGCAFPDHLLSNANIHVRYERPEDGSFQVGMTSVAEAAAGGILAVTPRRIGWPVEAGQARVAAEDAPGGEPA